MTADRIQVQLTPFEKVQILRDQQGERKKELTEVEAKLKELQRRISTHRYLESLSPYYAMDTSEVPSQDEVNDLEERRRLIKELLQTIEQELPAMLQTAQSGSGGGAVPAAPAAPSAPSAPSAPVASDTPVKKAKFDF